MPDRERASQRPQRREVSDSDRLRPPERIHLPDPRNDSWSVLDETTGRFRPKTLKDHYRAIACCELSDYVPEPVYISYETAKNLALYAWHVYRFFPVAEHHALTSLELGLKVFYGIERLEYKAVPKEYRGLRQLLGRAVADGHVRNDGFELWHHRNRVRARDRYFIEKIRKMDKLGLDEMPLDESEAVVTEADRDDDFVKRLCNALPAIRNNYAHGASTLHPTVIGTIQTVGEILNQLFATDQWGGTLPSDREHT